MHTLPHVHYVGKFEQPHPLPPFKLCRSLLKPFVACDSHLGNERADDKAKLATKGELNPVNQKCYWLDDVPPIWLSRHGWRPTPLWWPSLHTLLPSNRWNWIGVPATATLALLGMGRRHLKLWQPVGGERVLAVSSHLQSSVRWLILPGHKSGQVCPRAHHCTHIHTLPSPTDSHPMANEYEAS